MHKLLLPWLYLRRGISANGILFTMIFLPEPNLWLFSLVHSLVGQSITLDYVAIFFADYVQYVIGFVLVLVLLRPQTSRQKRIMVFVAVVAALTSRFMVKPFILLFITEPRPFIFLHFTPLINPAAGEEFQSFPSGHALFFFALATTIYQSNSRCGTLCFIAVIIMGFARVYTGVHWPLDILFGAAFGIIIGWLVHMLWCRFAWYKSM